jgi:hypothetical protein
MTGRTGHQRDFQRLTHRPRAEDLQPGRRTLQTPDGGLNQIRAEAQFAALLSRRVC